MSFPAALANAVADAAVEPSAGGGSGLTARAELYLSGRIAQFGRALAGDVSRRMFERFAAAVDRAATTGAASEPARAPNPLRMVLAALADRVRHLLARRR